MPAHSWLNAPFIAPDRQYWSQNDEIILHLTEHGCANLTGNLNPASPNPQPIAHGGFGSVYREELHDGRKVAVKALRVSLDDDDESGKLPKRAARELYTWSRCQHPNVLPLLGLAKFQDQIRMVSLWMENGNLPSYLDKHPELSRCDMSVHMCNGLEYLHRMGVIHGDFKGNNVLVSDDGIPIITDFGNAVLQQGTLQFTETIKQNGFTPQWTVNTRKLEFRRDSDIRHAQAPEIMTEETKQSKEADVYALGMTILEILTGKVPYFYITNVVAIITAIVVKKEAPKRPEGHVPSKSRHGDTLWSLLQSCWEFEPEKRPSAVKVAEILLDEGDHS
ncbi:hypothetical protein FS749_016360 [Ceratobasidium sp. UAMH 11750]|nr:hypothetical protein FS749_016360 [Ceratobasidium sp. UAMH 11750]